MERVTYIQLSFVGVAIFLLISTASASLYENYLEGRIIYGATNQNNSVMIGNNSCYTSIWNDTINLTCGGTILGINNLTANYFFGDGSGLTNLNVSVSPGGSSYNLTYHLTSEDVTANRSAFLSTYNLTYHNTNDWLLGNNTAWLSTFNQTYHDTTNKVNNNEATYNSTYNATYHALVANGLAYSLSIGGASQATMTDAQVMFWGGMHGVAPTTTADNTRVYIPYTGTVNAVYIFVRCGTAGTAETWGMQIIYDNSEITQLQNITIGNNRRVWSNTNVGLAVTQGHYLEIKELSPAWATNPATCTRSGVIYII